MAGGECGRAIGKGQGGTRRAAAADERPSAPERTSHTDADDDNGEVAVEAMVADVDA